MRRNLFIFFLTISLVGSSQEAQWRGPNRDGTFPDTNLLEEWPESGPELLQVIEGIGRGWSSAVVHSDTIYVAGRKDSTDMLSAFDFHGNLLWSSGYGSSWYASYPDSRNTPTVEGDRVFITSGMGEVVCLNARSGELIWKMNPHKEFKGVLSYWGMAESLLLTDHAVICTVGGEDASVVALDKHTGDLIWASQTADDARAYASPLLIERNGNKIILVELEQNLLGINLLNGEIFWTYSLKPDSAELVSWLNHTNTPLYNKGEIFITRGYDMDALMLSLSEDGRSIKLKWKNKILDTHIGGVVAINGFIFGSNWQSNSKGNWVCLNWDTGEVKYEQEWFNKGSVIYADGHLYCIEEKRGNVALVKAESSGFQVISTFRIKHGTGAYWAHPTIYNGNLLIRHGEVLMVYNLKKQINQQVMTGE